MDGREAMGLSGGSVPYYIHRGGPLMSGPLQHAFHAAASGFRPLSNPNSIQTQQNVGSTFSVEPRNANFSHGINMGMSPGAPHTEPVVKKKRGRPRKYAPDGQVSLGLSPMPTKLKPSSGSDTPKGVRGRPRGSGRKQRLAELGEWMNNSAGIAFAPHVISVDAGEDIVAKLLSFSQQRPRALCILSGTGTVSSVTLRQPATTVPTVTFEGRFEILCLSGSYLVAEDGAPRNRTGGVSASLCSPDGQVIGGGVAVLTAASLVQVVVCSFVYGGGSKIKNKPITDSKDELESTHHHQLSTKNNNTPSSAPPPPPTQNFSMSGWNQPGSRTVDLRNPHPDIDLTRG